jgi:M6 family metalloprotease-like protein
MKKMNRLIITFGFIALTACTSEGVSSLSSEPSSSATSSSSQSSIPEENAIACDTFGNPVSPLRSEINPFNSAMMSFNENTESVSSSTSEQNYKELVISRETWPLLTFSPFVPTRAFFNNVQFKYLGANNSTDNIIKADGSVFYLYNVTPLLNIEQVTLNKAQIKNRVNFKVYGSNMVIDDASNDTITEQEIIPTVVSPLVYVYDFSSYDFSYFRITNGSFPLSIRSLDFLISESFEFPDGLEGGGGEILPDTGEGYCQLTEPSITRDEYKYITGSPLEGAALPHLNNPKILVVPVAFTDYTCGLALDCDAITQKINKAFFGTSEDTPYESVRSYYYKSSYGNITIDGTMTPIYNTNMTTTNWAREKRTGREFDEYYHPAGGLTEDVIAWYKNLTSSNLNEYDGNGDGWIDAVYLLYLAPAYPNNPNYPTDVRERFWAYVYWNYNNLSLSDEVSPVPFTFSFLGYDFMNEGYGDTQIDAITYIHETGHILGLTDYYSYDTDAKAWGPAGGLDMMDNNILDHNAYSKFVLEWINPYVIDNTKQVTTLTIEPFESSGDAIIVKNDFNGSPYDNYLILEYFTPTGLNQKHSVAPYAGNNIQGFTESGVKIYHVDSRFAAYDSDTGDFIEFRDEIILPEGEELPEYYDIVNSNSVTRHNGDMTYMKLLHLLEANGQNTLIEGARATNNTLFQEGDSFNPLKHFSSMTLFGQFNDGTEIGYEIEIGEMTPEGVTITFTRWSF